MTNNELNLEEIQRGIDECNVMLNELFDLLGTARDRVESILGIQYESNVRFDNSQF